MEWIERLKCPKCAMAGNAELFEIGQFRNGYRKISEGFRLFAGPYGEEFQCVACEEPARTSAVK
jgi:hypothetical protein